jgi:hypothetical protein
MGQEDLRETLGLEQVVELREKTEKISRSLLGQLRDHLDTLRPLLAPARVFGKHVRSQSREDIPDAESALRKLCEKYNALCAKPFSLPPNLDTDAVADLDGRLELYPWEYTHEAKDQNQTKTITVTSPVRHVLTYRSSYSLSQIRLAVSGKGDRRQDDVREFLVAALAMQSALDKFPGLVRLLEELRYHVQVEKNQALGDLPLVIISSSLPSFRPPDSVVLATTRLSGVPAFIELVDPKVIQQIRDPLKSRLEDLLR